MFSLNRFAEILDYSWNHIKFVNPVSLDRKNIICYWQNPLKSLLRGQNFLEFNAEVLDDVIDIKSLRSYFSNALMNAFY